MNLAFCLISGCSPHPYHPPVFVFCMEKHVDISWVLFSWLPGSLGLCYMYFSCLGVPIAGSHRMAVIEWPPELRTETINKVGLKRLDSMSIYFIGLPPYEERGWGYKKKELILLGILELLAGHVGWKEHSSVSLSLILSNCLQEAVQMRYRYHKPQRPGRQNIYLAFLLEMLPGLKFHGFFL